MLAEPLDRQRLLVGLRFAYRFLQHPRLRPLWNQLMWLSFPKRVQALNRISPGNRVRLGLAALMLDGPALVRDLLMRKIMNGGRTVEEVIANEFDLQGWMDEAVYGSWHVGGTCKMGALDDSHAVVDPEGRVIGVDGLRVADASIMLTPIRATTNFTVIMIGEKFADAILTERASRTPDLDWRSILVPEPIGSFGPLRSVESEDRPAKPPACDATCLADG